MNPSLEERLRSAYAKGSRLLSLHMDLIYSCDLDCCHCYLDDKRTDALTTDEILETLDQARQMGALKLTLSGGELFLRKDLFTILEYARKSRFYIKLKTHGGLLTEEAADKLAEIGINRVDFSVYSLEEDVHDSPETLKQFTYSRCRITIDDLIIKSNEPVSLSDKEPIYEDLCANNLHRWFIKKLLWDDDQRELESKMAWEKFSKKF